MPKCERWIIAQRMVPVIDADTLQRIIELGGKSAVDGVRSINTSTSIRK